MLWWDLGILLLFFALGWLVDHGNPLRSCTLAGKDEYEYRKCNITSGCRIRCRHFKPGLVKALCCLGLLTAQACNGSTRRL